MQYDFDEIIDRRGTGALKYEALLPRWGRDDLLPLWVATWTSKPPRSSWKPCAAAVNTNCWATR